MGASKEYEELIIARADVEAKTAELITNKLNYLRVIGHSIMKKKFGHWRSQNLSYLGDIGLWLQHPAAKLVSLSSEGLGFEFNTAQGEKITFTLDRKILHLSDRDFAKLLRQKIYAQKLRLKKLELADSAKAIATTQKAIDNKRNEITQLTNDMTASQEMFAKEEAKAKKQAEK